MAGSAKEGCFSSGFFQWDNDFADGVHRMFELDLEITFFKFHSKYKHCFKDIVVKPGFLQVSVADRTCITPDLQNFHHTFYSSQGIRKFITNDGYINSYKVKQEYINTTQFSAGHKSTHITEILTAFLTGELLKNVHTSHVDSEVSKAVSTFSWNVFVNSHLHWKVSLDFAMVFRLDWASPFLVSYRKRSRNWPPMKELESELNVSYIITKTSNEERDNPDSTEFRYSFASLERKLVSLQSETQRKIYLILKSIVYKYIKPIHPEKISSFIAKNIMLWTCEQYPPEHSLWDKDAQSIVKSLQYLFGKLYQMFASKFMPYIFIPTINVLEHLSPDTKQKVAKKLQEISLSPLKYIPREAEKVTGILQNLLNAVHHIEDIAAEVTVFGPTVLLVRRPDLFYNSKYLQEYYDRFAANVQSTTINFYDEPEWMFPTKRHQCHTQIQKFRMKQQARKLGK